MAEGGSFCYWRRQVVNIVNAHIVNVVLKVE